MHTHFVRSMYCALMGAAFRMTPESVALHAGAIVFNGAFVLADADVLPRRRATC